MTLSRDLSETEYLVALVAGMIAAQAPGFPPDIAVPVGTAERICEEIIQRKDNPGPRPAPLPAGTLMVDEHSSQANDGSDKQRGISVNWKRGEEFGYEGDELTAEQSNSLMGTIIGAVEEWNDSFADGKFTVLYDRECGEASDGDEH